VRNFAVEQMGRGGGRPRRKPKATQRLFETLGRG
jgi:hypothetical protein